jgi:uncharacterized protein YndB with AHSA1/START domain
MTEPLPPITLSIETAATPAVAWATLTEPALIEDWFTKASSLGRVGDAYRLDFGDGSLVEGVVTSVEPGRWFSHTWVWAGVEPRQETLVTWLVEPLGDAGCRITLTHDGWEEAGLDQNARSDHEGYWIGYLDDLASVLSGDR